MVWVVEGGRIHVWTKSFSLPFISFLFIFNETSLPQLIFSRLDGSMARVV